MPNASTHDWQMLRRLRALAVLALLWAAPWAALGAFLGARFVVLDRAPPVLILVLSAWCAAYGLVLGLTFGLVILAAVRVRPRQPVSICVSALLVGVAAFALGASVEPGYVAAVLFALFGAGCAASSLRLAGARTAPT